MLTDQVKRRIPFEIKDKFLDQWDEIMRACYLAEKCDFDSYQQGLRNFSRMTSETYNFLFQIFVVF